MKIRILLLLAVALMLISLAPGQERKLVSQSDQDVIRVTVGLVQVDAVVTDSKGKHVVDLKPEDFEVTQDGKPQKITHFTFVSTTSPRPAAAPQPVRNATKSKIPIPPPPTRVKPNQVRRTMAFVVDDLGLSFESIAYVRKALQKFVDTQMQPGDLVAIVRTGAGMGALQAFTQDPRVLKAAIDKVKWNPMGRVGVSSFAPIGSEEGGSLAETEFRERIFSVGTMGAINYIVTGLKELPGRKSVILFTEHMRMFNRDSSTDQVYDAMLGLADEANRASVVIYTIDPRGLPTLSFTAADKITDTRPDKMAEQQMHRTQEHWESQEGMSYLADKTGGLFIHNTNDISGGIGKIIDDQVGYYLIGWSPGSDVFENADPKKAKELYRKYHKIRIHVKRAGLSIRTRDGYYGKPDTNEKPTYRTRDEQLFAALQSPFGSTDIPVHLTALFANNAKTGSYVYSLLHIDARNLTFEEEVATDEKTGKEKKDKNGKPEIWQKAVIDILMITFGDNGQELDRGNQTYTVRVRGTTYKNVLKNGFIYQMNHTIKKAGAYQLRAAVRDAGSGKAGSASQFIEVPDVTKGKLALSGIVLKERDPSMPGPAPAPGSSNGNGKAAPPPGAPAQTATKQGPGAAKQQVDDEDPQGGPGLRVFQPGKLLTYGVQVINAKADGGKQPAVDTQLHLYRDGKEMYVGKPIAVQSTEQPDPKRLVTGGYLRLGTAMEPGDYVLQIVATDRNASDKNNTATQWIDFEIAKKN